ncbi:glutathione S-transferase family protein [Marimonas lutisalis]|uniref:glutathione S-transferase family protein n=1 Tax=Marimonas lutisalis TaxID=2545756 RepID=UPI0010F888B4|nr:glutathione S-transferase [Marimonas lutisalis]
MLFYDCATAPSPRRARMFIAEKGLQIDTRQISIAEGEQLSADFLAVNPRATVPVLVTDEGTTLTENVAIATYLEARFPEPPLMGRNADEKGLVAMWNAISEHQGGMAVAEALRNSHPAMKDRALPGPLNLPQIPELAQRGHARVAAFFNLVEERLGHSRHLAGDNFTLADITAFVFIDFARVIRARIPEGNNDTRAWFDSIAARPSASL